LETAALKIITFNGRDFLKGPGILTGIGPRWIRISGQGDFQVWYSRPGELFPNLEGTFMDWWDRMAPQLLARYFKGTKKGVLNPRPFE